MSATNNVSSDKIISGGLLHLLGRSALAALAPVVFAVVLDLVTTQSPEWTRYLLIWSVFAVILVLSSIGVEHLNRPQDHYIRWAVQAAILLALVLSGWLTANAAAALVAWVLWGVLLLQLDYFSRPGRGLLLSATHLAFMAAVAASVPIAFDQISTRFSTEEYFVALSAVSLYLCWLAVLIVWRYSIRRTDRTETSVGLYRPRKVILVSLGLLSLFMLLHTVRAYQRSFYPQTAPQYPGITENSPFLCAELAADDASNDDSSDEIIDGIAVFDELMAALAQAPGKQSPELGMLAVGTGDIDWAKAFREAILEEAASDTYVGAAGSVKWAQHLASPRVYYFTAVQQAFPKLFSADEAAQIEAWFGAINRRAWTIEWVDWLYALALQKKPEGIYENQESGAGLLAMLEVTGLADADLRQRNQDYLLRNRRGWRQRFRNSDDADIYQIEWLTNAYFQALYEGEEDDNLVGQSFEWLLYQSLPDGTHPGVNHITRRSLAAPAYLAAQLTGDARYIWLAEQALAAPDTGSSRLLAQPGVETPLLLSGEAPKDGSCLIYGDSGLPNQLGPLAPDKIIFRDGWSVDSAYALLNLRFTGWHRYKATNTISVLYNGERIVHDLTSSGPLEWLPEGRSLFRDKRIPRENLNGVLIENSGLSRLLERLTGVGSEWAQDPPHYAEVVKFRPGQPGGLERIDSSHTRISDWRGWQHDRWVHLLHGGPIVVVDQAVGPASQKTAVTWHMTRPAQVDAQLAHRVRLLPSDDKRSVHISVQFIPLAGVTTEPSSLAIVSDDVSSTLTYSGMPNGSLAVATVFLPAEWSEADVAYDDATGPTLLITSGTETVEIPLFD